MAYIEIWSPNKENYGLKKNIIVIHTNEAGPYAPGKFPGTAESLGRYLLNPVVEASYQICVDRNGDVCRMVRDNEDAWAAGPIGNHEGLHLCFLGWSAQSREEWLRYPQQFTSAAQVIGKWCEQQNIPSQWLSTAELIATKWGITSHNNVSQAWHEVDHSDPGPNFPSDLLMEKVNNFLGKSAPTPDGTDAVTEQKLDQIISKLDQILIQLMGPEGKGWKELAPQRNPEGKQFSVFKFMRGEEPNVQTQTLVESLATLVFEATLRMDPYRGEVAQSRPQETVLGHAAIGAGTGLDLIKRIDELLAQQRKILEIVSGSVAEPVTTLADPLTTSPWAADTGSPKHANGG